MWYDLSFGDWGIGNLDNLGTKIVGTDGNVLSSWASLAAECPDDERDEWKYLDGYRGFVNANDNLQFECQGKS